MRKSLQIISNSVFIAIPISTIISVVLLPFGKIISNRYLEAGYFNTIIKMFFDKFLIILLPAIIIFLFLMIFFPKIHKKNHKKLKFISVILIILTFSLFIIKTLKKMEKRPNVLVIVIDTLRDDHTSFESPSKETTEKIRNVLGNKQIYFRSAHSNSPWTLPSISSLITSRYPSSLGIRNLVSKIADREFTIAEKLKEEGYLTHAIVSHILLKKVYGFSQGFDIFNEENIAKKFGNHYSISSPGITGDAINFLKNRGKEKFFLFLHYFDPHYIYLDHLKKSGYSGSFTSKDISFLREKIRKKEYTDTDLKYLKYCYDSEIAFTDKYIAKVIKTLKQEHLFDNTLIIITSDHGEEFVERGWLGHSTGLNREQTSVPLIIKPPSDFKEGHFLRVSDNVSNIDIVPTICSILKIGTLPESSGKDLFGESISPRPVFAEVSQKEFGSHIELISVIWKNYKMIKNLMDNSYRLYNIETDSFERKNIYGSNWKIESKLKILLKKWERENRTVRKSAGRKRPLSEKEKQRLKSLGYIN